MSGHRRSDRERKAMFARMGNPNSDRNERMKNPNNSNPNNSDNSMDRPRRRAVMKSNPNNNGEFIGKKSFRIIGTKPLITKKPFNNSSDNPMDKNTSHTKSARKTRSLLVSLVGLAVALAILRRFRVASGSNQTTKGEGKFKVTKLKGGFVRTETKQIGKRKPQRFRFIQPNPNTKIRLGFVESGRSGQRDDVVTEVAVFRR